jgi:hypothetical protein
MNTRHYQILQTSYTLARTDKPSRPEVICIDLETIGGSLVFVAPTQLYAATSLLERFGVRGIVLPDYVLTVLVRESGRYEFEVADVEFSDSSSVGTLAKKFISDKDTLSLYQLLEEVGERVIAISLRYRQFRIKLHGSGLITLESPAEMADVEVRQILRRLTAFLAKYLGDLDAHSASRLSLRANQIKLNDKRGVSLWDKLISPLLSQR